MIFSLQHGQAFVERGFSINNDILKPNMVERTIIAQRTVYDAVSSKLSDDPKAVQNIVVAKEMLRHCNAAKMRYRNFLDEQTINRPVANVSQERNSIQTEIAIAQKKDELFKEKEKIAASEKQILKITQEADELAVKAENKNKIQLLSESNERE